MARDHLARERVALVLLGIACASCSSGKGNTPDGAAAHETGIGEAGTDAHLWSCTGPGTACNTHDPCAINPVCGKDLLCRPESRQNCDDGLACTLDTCEGMGQCSHKVQSGFCALSVKKAGGTELACFAKGTVSTADACQSCDPDQSTTAWSPRNGGTCDDSNPCSKDDYCQSGVCKGSPYSCSDANDCTDDLCDGKGGCTNPPKPEVCSIGGKCYSKGSKDTTGCGTCDPAKTATDWTVAADKCLIETKCFAKGDANTTGCGVCDPAKDAHHWTPPADTCAINNACVSKGERNASGCGECTPAKNPASWSPVAGATASSTDFEAGAGGYTFSPAVNSVGWQVSPLRPHGGAQGLYYGNPAKKSFDSGGQNSGTATSATIALPAGQRAALQFWLWMDTETGDSFDVLTVLVDGTEVWRKKTSTLPWASYKQWVLVEVSLNDFAGKSVKLAFSFDTKDSASNTGEGVYLDEIAVITGCGPLPMKSPFVMDGKLDASAVKVAGGSGTMSLYLAFANDHLYLATDDAGEGNDNFILLSVAAPATPLPAPWAKGGTIALGGKPLFLADENDSTHNGWYRLTSSAGVSDTALAAGTGPQSSSYYSVATGANGGVLEGAINLKEIYGTLPSLVYLAAVAYGNGNGGALIPAAQTPATKDSDGKVDATELLKVSLPALTVVP